MALLVIFCVPFIGFGLFAAYAGLEKWIAGEPGEGAMLTLFGLLFVGIAFGVLALGRRGSRLKRQIESRKARYADAPWLWNEVVEEDSAKDPLFKKVSESYHSFRKSYAIWGTAQALKPTYLE